MRPGLAGMTRWLPSAGLWVGLAAAGGCSGEPPNPYPADVVENFVVACRTRAEERVCRCAIDRLQRRFSLEEFRAYEARIGQREVPKELVEAVEECRE